MNGFVFVPTAQNSGGISVFNRNNRNTNNFIDGETLTAVFMAREGGLARLRTADDFSFNVPENSIRGEVGDTLHFKIVKQDKSGLALRQTFTAVFDAIKERGNAGINDVKQVAKSLEQLNEEEAYRNETNKEEQTKVAQIVAQVKRGQQDISNSGQAAVAAIAASGLALHKISFFTLSNVIQNIETDVNINVAETVPPVENGKNGENVGNIPNGENITNIEKPQPPQNIVNTENTENAQKNPPQNELVLPKDIPALPDAAVAYLLRSEKEITSERIYMARYSTANEKPMELGAWASLDKQIAKIFTRENIENSPQNLEAARFLVAYNLPINRRNVEYSTMLRNLDLVPQAVEIAQKLPTVAPSDVKIVLEADKPLNLQNLTNVAESPKTALNDEYQKILTVEEKNLVTAQRQLVEIQWQMTVQAAIRLAHKGIQINTVPLQELVEHLRTLEQEGHAKALRLVGADTKHTSQISEVFRAIQEIKPTVSHMNANISGQILTQKVDFTLTGVHKAVVAYNASATVPSSRYGDTIEKVADQFEPLLKNIGIEPTAENIRAANILTRNNMNVASANLEAVKAIDAKISAVIERLHPTIAAQMIKEGLAPMDMQMDDILTYVRKFEEYHGYSGGDKIAQYILEMDREKNLTPKERSGMIAVYRMLNIIQKNGSAALGFALKQDAPLTLSSLMEAAKYYDSQKNKGVMDITVDDNFNPIDRSLNPPPTIREVISQEKPLSYTDLLADATTDKAAPTVLQDWVNDEVETALEDVLQQVKTESFKPDLEQAAQAMRQFVNVPPALITLMQNSGILPTSDNLKAMRKLRENLFLESLQEATTEIRKNNPELANILDSSFSVDNLDLTKLFQSSETVAKNGQKEVLQKLWNILDDATPTETARDAQKMLAIQYAMAEDNMMEIPIQLNGRFSDLKMYTLNESAVLDGTAKTLLTLNTAELGNVQSFFSIVDNTVNVEFSVESPVARIRLESNLDTLLESLQKAGYNLGQISFNYMENIPDSAQPAVPQGKNTLVDPAEDNYFPVETSSYEFEV
ncbi:MAG: DUF6240 domain-containing protein [Firmicutes bacterium]|nr:DUF6240 domain-containing protein [Bacillota bacterium]